MREIISENEIDNPFFTIINNSLMLRVVRLDEVQLVTTKHVLILLGEMKVGGFSYCRA